MYSSRFISRVLDRLHALVYGIDTVRMFLYLQLHAVVVPGIRHITTAVELILNLGAVLILRGPLELQSFHCDFCLHLGPLRPLALLAQLLQSFRLVLQIQRNLRVRLSLP